jgi:hypothetical protein
MAIAKDAYAAQAKVLKEIVKSRLFDEKIWPANPEVTDSMIDVFESMGLLTIGKKIDDECQDHIEATQKGELQNIKLLMSIAGFETCPFCMSDDIILVSEIPELDENILVNSFDEPWYYFQLRPVAMRAYYKYYGIAIDADEAPLDCRVELDDAQGQPPKDRTLH